ncbi:MAG: hypothetical protein KGL94_04505 [Acidobacteriota bacterium]|nr:hypothetical protein [Acidobacteriota bacterium]
MNRPFREHILACLADREWHHARDLVRGQASLGTLAAFVRVLRAAGYDIEQDGERERMRYRLRRPA